MKDYVYLVTMHKYSEDFSLINDIDVFAKYETALDYAERTIDAMIGHLETRKIGFFEQDVASVELCKAEHVVSEVRYDWEYKGQAFWCIWKITKKTVGQ